MDYGKKLNIANFAKIERNLSLHLEGIIFLFQFLGKRPQTVLQGTKRITLVMIYRMRRRMTIKEIMTMTRMIIRVRMMLTMVVGSVSLQGT